MFATGNFCELENKTKTKLFGLKKARTGKSLMGHSEFKASFKNNLF